MSTSSADAWNRGYRVVSADAPDTDTEKLWRLCSSSNALFPAQPPDFYFSRVDNYNWLQYLSLYVPNSFTESVFLLRRFILPSLPHHMQHLLTGHFDADLIDPLATPTFWRQ